MTRNAHECYLHFLVNNYNCEIMKLRVMARLTLWDIAASLKRPISVDAIGITQSIVLAAQIILMYIY